MKTMAQVINEYAKALFDLSQETDCVKEISSALDTVVAVVDENPEYLDFLSSPNIPKSERINAVEQAFSSLHEYAVSFVSLLCERGRAREIKECVTAFRELCSQADKISVAQVTSAVELTDAQKDALALKLQKICGNRVVLECKTDKSLIGGMVVGIDGKIIDGSVRSRLHELKEVMYK